MLQTITPTLVESFTNFAFPFTAGLAALAILIVAWNAGEPTFINLKAIEPDPVIGAFGVAMATYGVVNGMQQWMFGGVVLLVVAFVLRFARMAGMEALS